MGRLWMPAEGGCSAHAARGGSRGWWGWRGHCGARPAVRSNLSDSDPAIRSPELFSFGHICVFQLQPRPKKNPLFSPAMADALDPSNASKATLKLENVETPPAQQDQ